MNEGPDITVRDARVDEAGEILRIQQAAFLPAARRYDEVRLPPLIETADDVVHDIREHLVLVATDSTGRILGSVRGKRQEECVHVGRLVVDPQEQRRGVATALMLELEQRFPEAECFELFTGGLNEPGMGLYLKLGYVETRRERETELLEIVYLRHDRRSRSAGGGGDVS
ncbi:MAG: GNAT family N-acetyltransferase [Coriobacteriia bacterium]|nr:GNAT family N-acetyltransferase [Coriobacteriia bacterium]